MTGSRTCTSFILTGLRLPVDPSLEMTPSLSSGNIWITVCFTSKSVIRSGGVTYLGQDQDSMGGGFNPRQSWSGEITQFNVWDFPLEEWMVENAAECRSDILGNVMKWQADLWIPNEVIRITSLKACTLLL